MEPPRPRISTILIFLNGEAFLDAAIKSVMAQSFSDFELLLCDDGSEQAASEIAKAWAAEHPKKIRYLEHEGHANHGMSATRNLGLEAARGEFIAFIDADDVWRTDKLSEQIDIMDAHPELGMVCGVVNYWRSWTGGDDVLTPTGHAQNTVVRPPEASLALYPLGKAVAPCPSDMLLRRAAVDAVGRFEVQFRGAYEDQAFLAKLYLAWPIYFSDRTWIDYRQHAASCTSLLFEHEGTRTDRYNEVRYSFLTWFDGYLRAHSALEDRMVRRALNQALWPYRYPILHWMAWGLRKSPRRVVGKLWKLLAPAD
ncbi:glycosyltransferase family 2 protein [Microvirga terrae]|uniref:Glycosyltransferase family 2 protein n=1 Tax=Microvirga terrae TaxID=2740529 RepID=A0ABY5RQE7_9HYPH|nr:glycosyltransferase family A protein [Microvirga terrae]UVF18417.1 glycosyltransferase family 2 protein [Microvirga terrae]